MFDEINEKNRYFTQARVLKFVYFYVLTSSAENIFIFYLNANLFFVLVTSI